MTQQYRPKCPTCGSPNVEKIPSRFSEDPKAEAVRILVFGRRRQRHERQFRCKDCGYEW